jgi:hypothetical protein
MEPVHEDRFVVFVRADRRHDQAPEEAERPVTSCATYAQAHRIKQRWQQAGRECVIRFVGIAGGGD